MTGSEQGSTSTPLPEPQTILVVDVYGDPQPDVPVVVNDASGAVANVGHTRTDGTTTVQVPPGGSVSVFQAHTTTLSVSTVVDPPPGAKVRFPITQPSPKLAHDENITTYEVTLADIPVGSAYLRVQLDGNCGTDGSWVDQSTMTIKDGLCATAPSHRLIAFALDDEQKLMRWGDASVTTTPGETIPLSVALNHENVTTTNMNVTGIPFGTSEVYLFGTLTKSWGGGQHASLKPPKQPTDGAPISIANVPDIDRRLYATVSVGDGATGASVRRSQQFSPAGTPATWTFEADDPSWVFVGPADASVPEHPTFAWSTADPETADYVVVYTAWAVGAGTVEYDVLLPPTHVPSWRMPDVPEELSSFRPHGSSVLGEVSVFYVAWDSIDGYSAVIAGLPAEGGEVTIERVAWAPGPQ
jgi:hypothetical protein